MCLWCTTRLLPGLCSGLYLCVFVGLSFRSVCFSFTKSTPSCVITVITCHFSCGTCGVAQGSALVPFPFLLKCCLWQCLHFLIAGADGKIKVCDSPWFWFTHQAVPDIHEYYFGTVLKDKLCQPSRRYYFVLRKQIFVCHQAVNQVTGICCFSDLANPHLLLDLGNFPSSTSILSLCRVIEGLDKSDWTWANIRAGKMVQCERLCLYKEQVKLSQTDRNKTG